MYSNADRTKLKTFVFNTKMRFNQARFEAVKRSRDVYLDFDIDDDGIDNGFIIWVDDNGDGNYDVWNDPYDPATDDANGNGFCDNGEGDCDGDGVCDPGEGDCIIETVVFANKLVSSSNKHGAEIYGDTPAFPAGGPGTDGPGDSTIGNGVSAGSEKFQFMPDGDSRAGTAYFYFPKVSGGAKAVASGPWAIIVNTVGRIRVDEWRSTSGWDVDQD
jgi:hypothetical protein